MDFIGQKLRLHGLEVDVVETTRCNCYWQRSVHGSLDEGSQAVRIAEPWNPLQETSLAI